MRSKKSINYINNESFIEALLKYRQECIDLKQERPQTKTYDYLGKCFMEIAKKLSNSYNFRGYSFKEEMIADAIEVCVRRIDNFSTEKSTNAFAYFTQLCWFAFVARIKAEEKQQDVKSNVILNSGVLDDLPYLSQIDDNFETSGLMQYLLENISKPKQKIDKKHQKTTLEYQNKNKENAPKKKRTRKRKMTKSEQEAYKEMEERLKLEEKTLQEIDIEDEQYFQSHDFPLDEAE